MISVDEALRLVLNELAPLGAERVPLAEAAGRVVASAAVSAVDLPPFDRSAMDGYAVRAADTAPGVALRLVGGVAAGEVATAELEPGTATRVSTGAAIPPGADAVLQSELATETDGHVRPSALSPRARTSAGAARTCTPATELAPRRRPAHPPAHLRAGLGRRRRGRRPPAPAAAPDRHRQRAAAARRSARAGADPRVQRPDGAPAGRAGRRGGGRPRRDRRRLRDRRGKPSSAGLEGDVLVVSGGVSVGPHDHVKPAFESCGVDEVFWRVQIKPGKPLWFGRRGETLVFGLPGNPLSTIVCFAVFIEPALRRLARRARRVAAAGAGPPDDRGSRVRRPHHVPHRDPAPGRRRRPRGHTDRAPGLAHDRRARRERRLRRRARGGRRAAGRRPPSTCCAWARRSARRRSLAGGRRTRGARDERDQEACRASAPVSSTNAASRSGAARRWPRVPRPRASRTWSARHAMAMSDRATRRRSAAAEACGGGLGELRLGKSGEPAGLICRGVVDARYACADNPRTRWGS